MIRHMIFWDLADETANRAQMERFLKESFAAMVGEVPGLRSAHIGFDQGPGTHAVGLCCDLDSMEALAVYQDFPAHVTFKEWAKVHLKNRCCIDMEVEE